MSTFISEHKEVIETKSREQNQNELPCLEPEEEREKREESEVSARNERRDTF